MVPKTKMFWFVWRPTGGQPTKRHESYESARSEAARLAATTPGEFHVLQLVGTYTTGEPQWAEAVEMTPSEPEVVLP